MNMHPKPDWLKIKPSQGGKYIETSKLIKEGKLNTVCNSALCPNRAECWGRATATFMLLGELCTRKCRFCAVSKSAPEKPDFTEPLRLAENVKKLNLKYAVLTSPTRDDLQDGGAGHWADCMDAIRKINSGIKIEILIPDFQGVEKSLDTVLNSKPDVFGHNLETVEQLQETIRIKANYATSLKVLEYGVKAGVLVKSGLMLGLGETEKQIEKTIQDLSNSGVQILTLGQYLRPTKMQIEVSRYVTPAEFAHWKIFAKKLGFKSVQSDPFVRSSYKAAESYLEALT